MTALYRVRTPDGQVWSEHPSYPYPTADIALTAAGATFCAADIRKGETCSDTATRNGYTAIPVSIVPTADLDALREAAREMLQASGPISAMYEERDALRAALARIEEER